MLKFIHQTKNSCKLLFDNNHSMEERILKRTILFLINIKLIKLFFYIFKF